MAPFLANILSIIPNVVGMASDALEARRTIKAKKVDAQIKLEDLKVRSIERRLDKDLDAVIDWDNQQVVNSQSSWKDEFWTIVLSIPAIFCFVPGMSRYIEEGFQVLEQTPVWYQAALGVAIGAAFGYKKLVDFMGLKKRKAEEDK